MKIETLTIQQMLELLGSEATEAEALAMLELIQKEPVQDTKQITDARWRELMDKLPARQ